MRYPILVAVVLFWSVSSRVPALGQLAAQESGRAAPVNTTADLYFPSETGTWEHADVKSAGWNQRQLDELVVWAGEQGSTSVLILLRGRILAEKHWGKGSGEMSQRYQRMFVRLNENQQAIEDVASVQKSVVSILVGIAIEKNLLKLGDPVSKHLGVGWSNAKPHQEAKIKVKHVLSMTSGLTEELYYQADPGTRWLYNTAAYAVARDCLVATSGLTVHELTDNWLTVPIGMKESSWVPRAKSITALNAFGFASSARDLARVGLLMQAGGEWAGKTVLPNEDFRLASLKTSQALNPTYGYLWWLNNTLRITTAPADTYAANGALGRRVFVAPSEGLVVVRLGDEPKTKRTSVFDREFWRRLMAAKS
ncbi:beta-lactamase family protein [bacterium]|nr:beta-lactamase family protein [bacterium]